MCSSLSIHRRGHSAVVSKMTINYSVMGLGGKCGKWSQPCFFSLLPSVPASMLQGEVRHTNTKQPSAWSQTAWERSGQHKEALCRARGASMYAQEIARGCVHNVTKSLLFCCVNILNAALEKRSTAFSPFEDMIFIKTAQLFRTQTTDYGEKGTF